MVERNIPQGYTATVEKRQSTFVLTNTCKNADDPGELPPTGDTTNIMLHVLLMLGSGSIYDGTMQIGATTQKGQYDFYRELSVGDTLIYTDVEGNQYTFVITSLRYEEHADQAALQREEAPLTLFLKNIYSFEYLIIFCDVLY